MNPRATASDALLGVTCTTQPPHLTVSTITDLKKATLFLTFAKLPDTPDVTCNKITVTLPVGVDDDDLVNDDDRGSDELIDDYPHDSTGAEWTIERFPPAALATAPDWLSTPGHGLQEMFINDDEHYFQSAGRPAAESTLTVDYGTVQEISTVNIATGLLNELRKVPPFVLEYSVDGERYGEIFPAYMDTKDVQVVWDPPRAAQFLRIRLVNAAPEDSIVIRRFLINQQEVARAGGKSITFTCTPPGGKAVFDDDRQFNLTLSKVPVNKTAGAASLTITETTTADGAEPETRDLSLDPIVKLGQDFVFENFSCEKPQVANGESTTLHWQGSPHNSEYLLYQDDKPGRKPTVTQTNTDCSCPTGPLTHTTTFVLYATTQTNAGVVGHYRSTTITVGDPDIAAKTLTTTHKVVVDNAFTAKSARETGTTHQVSAAATTFNADVTID